MATGDVSMPEQAPDEAGAVEPGRRDAGSVTDSRSGHSLLPNGYQEAPRRGPDEPSGAVNAHRREPGVPGTESES